MIQSLVVKNLETLFLNIIVGVLRTIIIILPLLPNIKLYLERHACHHMKAICPPKHLSQSLIDSKWSYALLQSSFTAKPHSCPFLISPLFCLKRIKILKCYRYIYYLGFDFNQLINVYKRPNLKETSDIIQLINADFDIKKIKNSVIAYQCYYT